jgi:hypothetical protein
MRQNEACQEGGRALARHLPLPDEYWLDEHGLM